MHSVFMESVLSVFNLDVTPINCNMSFFSFQDECFTNADCNGHGKCIDIDATSYPKKQCFCEKGWFGINCELGK